MPRASQQQAVLLISGHVQGVFFRAHAQGQALKLGLAGYARNLAGGRISPSDKKNSTADHQTTPPDKQVEILLQGPRDKIFTFIEWAKKGSPKAKVTGLKITWQTLESQRDNFLIT